MRASFLFLAAPAAALLLLSSLPAHAGDGPTDPEIARVLAALPAYDPKPVEVPLKASYLAPDGSIQIVGYNDMQGMFERWDRLFTASHPGFSFKLKLTGTKAGPAALAKGESAFAPMGAEYYEEDIAAHRKALGSYPLILRVAHDSLSPLALSSPMAIVVPKGNPLVGLTTDQVTRIFTLGSTRGEITRWGQLGLSGEWADRPIHAYGMPGDTALATFMQKHAFRGRPFRADMVAVPRSTDVVKKVTEDPLGIGFSVLSNVTPAVRTLAIRAREGGRASAGTAADLIAGLYPYDRVLLIYARQPLDPFVREYLRMILSREGQEALATERLGYLPLSATDLEHERSKLDR